MAAVPPALVPKLHNSVFSCMSLVPLELPPLQWRPGDVCQQVSLCGELLRGYPGFQPLAISPRWADRVLANFHCQMFWVLLWTPGLGSLAWGWELSIFRPGGGVYLHHQGVPPICGFGVSLFSPLYTSYQS